MDKLILHFEEELKEKCYRAKKECKYNPTYFNQMLAELGGVGTAKRLIEKGIKTGNPSDGYTTLFICQRLDLTMEDSVSNEKYASLFTKEEIDYCMRLLGRK